MLNRNDELLEDVFTFDFTKHEYPIISKIRKFSTLEDNWHYGEGHRIDSKSIEAAIDFCFFLYDRLFTELDAFPGLDGEILIKAYFPKHSVEIFIKDSLVGYYNVEDKSGNDLFNSIEMPISDLKKQILSQRQREWNSLESSHSIITRKRIKDSAASLLEIPQTIGGVVYPLYVSIAQMNNLWEFVNISGENILNIPTLLYIGNSVLPYYQQVVD